jgi:hypothetical protein
MHRSRFRSNGTVVLGLRVPRRPILAFLVLGVVASAILAVSTAQAPARHTAIPPSCKPLPPYDLQMQAAGAGQWMLSLHNATKPGDVVVWMWSEVGSDSETHALPRQRVWAGTLQEQELRNLTVSFTPAADAVQVWASVESPQTSVDASIQRGLAVAPGPAAAGRRAAKTSVLLEEPSGRRVQQFVGQGGLQ